LKTGRAGFAGPFFCLKQADIMATGFDDHSFDNVVRFPIKLETHRIVCPLFVFSGER
jgi:hypothetical protein